MRSSVFPEFSSLLRLALLLAALLQITCGRALEPRGAYDMEKFNDEKRTYYKVIKTHPFFRAKPSLDAAKSAASGGYKSFADQASFNHYVYEGKNVINSHLVFALVTDKGTVIASVPFGKAADDVKSFMKDNDVFKSFLDDTNVKNPHAEHHALYWAIKELGIEKDDLKDDDKQKFGAPYGLLPGDLEVNDKNEVVVKSGKEAGPRSPCAEWSSNDQTCHKMLSNIDVKFQ